MTTEIDAERLSWPERLTLRDTKVYADEGQRIFTTATGHGYARQEYVRADLATTRTSEAEPVACADCGAKDPFMYPCHQQGCPHSPTPASDDQVEAVTIDREALRKRIENDPDEGEIGAGFEMFTPEAEVALERMAFAALPRWAQDELTALRAAATLPTPASDDQVEAAAKALYEEDDPWNAAFPWPNPSDGPERAEAYRRLARAALAAMGSTKP